MSALTNNAAVRYFREAYEELKKVTWPSRQDTVRYSVAIMVMSVVLGAYFGLFDWLMTRGLAALVNLTS